MRPCPKQIRRETRCKRTMILVRHPFKVSCELWGAYLLKVEPQDEVASRVKPRSSSHETAYRQDAPLCSTETSPRPCETQESQSLDS